MPQILLEIDTISRNLGRDILFADIPIENRGVFEVADPDNNSDRDSCILFLNDENINWYPCFGVFSNSGWRSPPNTGTIFIDVPNDPNSLQYQKICAFFETPDGAPRLQNFHLFLLPLVKAQAVLNAKF